MARDQEILHAAAALFFKRGYHATTMRDLAAHVGIEAPSLYNHFPSKHAVLATLLLGSTAALLDSVRGAVARAGDDPVRRLTAAMAAYIRFHEKHLIEASIADTERRYLEKDASRQLLAMRDELASMIRSIVQDGTDVGRFDVADVSIATLFLLSIPARIPVWFRTDGPMNLDKIGDIAIDFALRALAPHTR